MCGVLPWATLAYGGLFCAGGGTGGLAVHGKAGLLSSRGWTRGAFCCFSLLLLELLDHFSAPLSLLLAAFVTGARSRPQLLASLLEQQSTTPQSTLSFSLSSLSTLSILFPPPIDGWQVHFTRRGQHARVLQGPGSTPRWPTLLALLEVLARRSFPSPCLPLPT